MKTHIYILLMENGTCLRIGEQRSSNKEKKKYKMSGLAYTRLMKGLTGLFFVKVKKQRSITFYCAFRCFFFFLSHFRMHILSCGSHSFFPSKLKICYSWDISYHSFLINHFFGPLIIFLNHIIMSFLINLYKILL